MLQGLFWLHDLLPDVSDDFQGLVMARSKLADETVNGVSIYCFDLEDYSDMVLPGDSRCNEYGGA